MMYIKSNIVLFSLSLCLVIIGCSVVRKKHQGFLPAVNAFQTIDSISIPTLSNEKMFFKDTKKFRKIRKKIPSQTKSNKKWYTVVDTVPDKYKNHSETIFYFASDTLTAVSEIYTVPSYIPDKFLGGTDLTFRVAIHYYPDGKIRLYAVALYGAGFENLKVGTWYYFDKKGNVVKKIAHEELYVSSIKDIIEKRLAFFKDQVRHKDVYITPGNIFRYADNSEGLTGEVFWIWSYEQNNKRMIARIDDRTGDITSMEEAELEDIATKYKLAELYKIFYED